MNLTHFLEHGGSACARTDVLSDVIRYSPDPTKPGCDAAYTSFRAATTPTFTCDCLGDHAFLGGAGGLRSGTMFTISNIIGIVLTALMGPAVGTWIDHNGGKRVWIALLATAGSCLIGQAALGSGYVWVVGLVVSVITIVASELATIPRQSYLFDVVDPDAPSGGTPQEITDANAVFQTRVSGNRIITSYLSQIVFVLIALVLTVALGLSTTLASQIITILAGVWYLASFAVLVPKFPTRPPTRDISGRNFCSVGYGQLWTDLKTIAVSYPEAHKYLIFLFIVQNGTASTVLSIAISFTNEQLGLSSFQNQVIFVVTLICGPLWIKLMHLINAKMKFSYKRLLLAIIFVWILAIIMIGVVVNNMGKINGSWTAGFLIFVATSAVLIAPGLTWYYTLHWPAFAMLVPAAQVNQFGGIFTMVRTLGLIPQPLIYVVCSNGFKSASEGRQVGILTMLIWDLLAIPFLLWINFDKGKAEADAATAKKNGASVYAMAAVPDSNKSATMA